MALHAKVTRAPRALPRAVRSFQPTIFSSWCRRSFARTAAAAEGTHVDASFFHDKHDDDLEGVRREQTAVCRFEINMNVEFGDEVVVVGNAEALGSWALR